MNQKNDIRFQAPDYWYRRGLNILKLVPGTRLASSPGRGLEVEVTDSGQGELTVIVRRGAKSWEKTVAASHQSFLRALFLLLSEDNGQPLSPWGILTGVRPGKLAATLMRTAGPRQAALQLQRDYLVAADKAELVMEAVVNGLPLLTESGLSIYVSVPFCPSRCHYCSFASHLLADWKHLVDDYLIVAAKELQQVLDFCRNRRVQVNSIYVGGGTPTVLQPAQLEQLLQPAANPGCEFTVEAGRPDTVNGEKLAVLAALGVNRVSVNCQFPDDATLAAIGRTHSVAEFEVALEAALASAIPVVNTDLVVGLPGQHARNFCRALTSLVDRKVENITIHSLAVKRGAQIRNQYLAPEEAADIARQSYRLLKDAGYLPYYLYRQKNIAANQENVGFGRPGTFCYYNIASIAESEPVIGVGAAAVSKLVNVDSIETLNNPRDPGTYLQRSQDLLSRKLAWLDSRFC